MWSAFDQIESAVQKLQIPDHRFRQLPHCEALAILQSMKARYCQGRSPFFWWEYYIESESFRVGDIGHQLLEKVAPEETVYFIPHGEDKEHVYQAQVSQVTLVLNESCFFEYSIGGVQGDWLITENHHGYLFVVGEKVKPRLSLIKDAMN